MIAENLNKIRATIPEAVTLIAVSKTKPNSDLMEAYDAGQRIFGENKVQELAAKYESLPKDIEWHMIGHLQSNKVKYIAPFISLIHGVDSLKLLIEINKQAKKNDRIIDCLLQMYIADEETKFGLDFQEINELLSSKDYVQMQNIRIVGLMGMATNTDNEEQIREEFGSIKDFFGEIQQRYFTSTPSFKEISTGMSGDYLIAIQEGSTMVRVGSSIFGSRNHL